ncbi:hypothetical protein Pmar_PMAR018598 [Perkinsus marinus ATCC 50983]|uniref:Uncharacterized protein n=1 Tax=Perkinsus marinus (strain ATCC 50983 / TXsc) TaxID=423536 RepID=C5L095_PERM5|nr:hypothetical protein Pmar_PMAR018598 [Perkinsus marinus ATCC 50983]EER09953.1 hypothetical protein Pmar_PMAR018598 [Perkinsus marinus ATCC 50983]|eukprot:XP_002778158.1 hypothetical protein Pmar_PMAR018598 [Perkinsus marinus ATCC 50983]
MERLHISFAKAITLLVLWLITILTLVAWIVVERDITISEYYGKEDDPVRSSSTVADEAIATAV